MAPHRRARVPSHKSPKNYMNKVTNFVINEILTLRMLYEQKHFQLISFLLLIVELFLNISIVNRIKYTEIDWSTYMQQVECFLNGTLDYTAISGDTGPIVYPAGHLYIYTLFYFLTNRGTNIFLAQHIFICLYLANLFVVFRIYRKYSKVPPYILIFMCCTSYRVHSLYVLRLFNDSIAIFFLYLALLLILEKKWILGSIFYSLAVSVKMNILLFAPALFLILCESMSKVQVVKQLVCCAFVQILLGLPFLVSHPVSYVRTAFNLGRVFLHKWTVNYRFLPEEIFVNSRFHVLLLALHLLALFVFFSKRWIHLLANFMVNKTRQASPSKQVVLMTMFVSNFIGITFARSLHYQFYVWYYHSLPYILWNTGYPTMAKICILGLIELVWNVYPSTAWSSALLHVLHLVILLGLARHRFTNGLNWQVKIE